MWLVAYLPTLSNGGGSINSSGAIAISPKIYYYITIKVHYDNTKINFGNNPHSSIYHLR